MSYGQLIDSSVQGSMSDLSLYSSPSLPNISLGRPPAPSSSRVRKFSIHLCFTNFVVYSMCIFYCALFRRE